jgi:arginase
MKKNKMKYILPNPFSLSTYGHDDGQVYKDIINLNGANLNAAEFFPSNQITSHCMILPAVTFDISKVLMDDPQTHVFAGLSMQESAQKILTENIKDLDFELFVIGGDHTISIGTGAYLSQILDMSKVGLIWVDAHGDFNTSSTSSSKSLTGYPCAINMGLGDDYFVKPFGNNFVTKCVQIGIRDIDELEHENMISKSVKTYSNVDVEDLGLKAILNQTLDYFLDCDFIWLSIDIDSLDPIYCDQGRTDVPVNGGLTPRELQYITTFIKNSGKLKITELVQINNTKNNFNLVALGNRLVEIAMGLGSFRVNK